MKLRKDKGFTLIELLVVVAIISLLAAVAIPKYGELLEKTKLGATLGNLSSLRSSVSIYYATFAELPRSIDPEDEPQFATAASSSLPFVKSDYPGGARSPKGNQVEVGVGVPTDSGKGWYYNNETGYIYINSIEEDISGSIYSKY